MQTFSEHLIAEAAWTPDMSTFQRSPIINHYQTGQGWIREPNSLPPDESGEQNHPSKYLGSQINFSFDVHHELGHKKTHHGSVIVEPFNLGSRASNLWTLNTARKAEFASRGGDNYTATQYSGNQHTKAIEGLTHELLDHFFANNHRQYYGNQPPIVASTTWEPDNQRLELVKARFNYNKLKRYADKNPDDIRLYTGHDIPEHLSKWVNIFSDHDKRIVTAVGKRK